VNFRRLRKPPVAALKDFQNFRVVKDARIETLRVPPPVPVRNPVHPHGLGQGLDLRSPAFLGSENMRRDLQEEPCDQVLPVRPVVPAVLLGFTAQIDRENRNLGHLVSRAMPFLFDRSAVFGVE